jgi:hypothetical protein
VIEPRFAELLRERSEGILVTMRPTVGPPWLVITG